MAVREFSHTVVGNIGDTRLEIDRDRHLWIEQPAHDRDAPEAHNECVTVNFKDIRKLIDDLEVIDAWVQKQGWT